MEKIKSLTIRIDEEKWQKAKVKMLLEGRTFQDICEEAIDRYIEKNDDKEKK